MWNAGDEQMEVSYIRFQFSGGARALRGVSCVRCRGRGMWQSVPPRCQRRGVESGRADPGPYQHFTDAKLLRYPPY